MFSLLITALFINKSVAHAPELHKKEKDEKPQCHAVSKMDLSQIDPNDAVMQAILIQCKDWLHDAHHDNSEKEKPEKKNKNNNS